MVAQYEGKKQKSTALLELQPRIIFIVLDHFLCYNDLMLRTRLFRILSGSLMLGAVPPVCSAAAGADAFAAFIADHILQEALIAFWGISAMFLLYYAFRMIMKAQKEQTLSTARQSFVYAFFGFVTIALGVAFADAFFTNSFSGNVTGVNPSALVPGLASVSDFIITGSSGVFVLIVTFSGLRMVTSQGDQGEFDKWRKVLVANVIGVIIMLLASIMINAIAGVDAGAIGTELAGLMLFILTIFGFACAVALIIAGIMLIVSVDEGLKDRAKKIVFGTLISLALVLALVAIINAFVFSSAP